MTYALANIGRYNEKNTVPGYNHKVSNHQDRYPSINTTGINSGPVNLVPVNNIVLRYHC